MFSFGHQQETQNFEPKHNKKKHYYRDCLVFVEEYEILQIPMNSVPSCEYTMKPRGFVMFSSLSPHSHKTKP